MAKGVLYRGGCYSDSSVLKQVVFADYPFVSYLGTSFSQAYLHVNPANFVLDLNYSANNARISFQENVAAANVWNAGSVWSINYLMPFCETNTSLPVGSGGVFGDIPTQDLLVFIALAFSFIFGLQAGRK